MSKSEQRAAVLAARRALSPERRRELSLRICEKLLTLCPEGPVMSYLALPEEVDLSALHQALREAGVPLAFPRCREDGSLEARIPQGELVRGRWGVREPDPAASLLLPPEALRLVICPCLGFDDGGRRLGHGAGCYDRFLPLCTHARVLTAAFQVQRLDRVETENHDRDMDGVVTEEKVLIFR